MGLLGIATPEEQGGLGGDFLTSSIVIDELWVFTFFFSFYVFKSFIFTHTCYFSIIDISIQTNTTNFNETKQNSIVNMVAPAK